LKRTLFPKERVTSIAFSIVYLYFIVIMELQWRCTNTGDDRFLSRDIRISRASDPVTV